MASALRVLHIFWQTMQGWVMSRWISACLFILYLSATFFPHCKQEYRPSPSFCTMASSAAFRSKRGNMMDEGQLLPFLYWWNVGLLIEVPCQLLTTFFHPYKYKCSRMRWILWFSSFIFKQRMANLITLSRVRWLLLGVPWNSGGPVHFES